jgi:hypothetical protein
MRIIHRVSINAEGQGDAQRALGCGPTPHAPGVEQGDQAPGEYRPQEEAELRRSLDEQVASLKLLLAHQLRDERGLGRVEKGVRQSEEEGQAVEHPHLHEVEEDQERQQGHEPQAQRVGGQHDFPR